MNILTINSSCPLSISKSNGIFSKHNKLCRLATSTPRTVLKSRLIVRADLSNDNINTAIVFGKAAAGVLGGGWYIISDLKKEINKTSKETNQKFDKQFDKLNQKIDGVNKKIDDNYRDSN